MHTDDRGTGVDESLAGELRTLAREVFGDHAAAPAAPTVEQDLDPDLWDALTELGLTRLTGAESTGGSGASWREAAVLLAEAAAHGIPLPLLEHDLLAGWLRDTAGLPTGEDALAAAALVTTTGAAQPVPWLSAARTVVVLDATGPRPAAYEIAVADLRATPTRGVHGEPRDIVTLPTGVAGATDVAPDAVTEFEHRGALGRAVQMAGAMAAVSRLCVGHATSRVQFGRPLGRFQAVQQLVTDVADEAALSQAIVDRAVQAAAASGFGDPHTRFLVAAAKACTGDCVTRVVRAAHQVHGAIGTTLEHPLQRYTRPLLAWRRDHGSTGEWEHRLETTALTDAGGDLWDAVSR